MDSNSLIAAVNVTLLQDLSDSFLVIINSALVPALIGVAFVVFLFGVYNYFIQGAADEASRAKGRQFVMWGLIGFVVIFSMWGIVNILVNTVNLSDTTNSPQPPIL